MTRKQNHRGSVADSLKTELRTSIRRVKAISLAVLLSIALFPRETDSQSRRQNSLDEFDWEESEEDQQCEMVVKCKPAKSASSSSSSRTTSNAPETSTYRVPLKPFGAPFNPMAEGGSVMWQKMGATPKTKNNKKSRVISTTTATNYGEKSNTDNDKTVKSGNSSRRRKKIRKGTIRLSDFRAKMEGLAVRHVPVAYQAKGGYSKRLPYVSQETNENFLRLTGGLAGLF